MSSPKRESFIIFNKLLNFYRIALQSTQRKELKIKTRLKGCLTWVEFNIYVIGTGLKGNRRKGEKDSVKEHIDKRKIAFILKTKGGMMKEIFVLLLIGAIIQIQSWWNENWSARTKVRIDATPCNVDLTDYTIHIQVGFGEAMQDDFADIRFIDSDDKTKLSYWAEYINASPHEASFWVKIPGIPVGDIKEIWMYYGNPQATSISNGPATFFFFDNFEEYPNNWELETSPTPTCSWYEEHNPIPDWTRGKITDVSLSYEIEDSLYGGNPLGSKALSKYGGCYPARLTVQLPSEINNLAIEYKVFRDIYGNLVPPTYAWCPCERPNIQDGLGNGYDFVECRYCPPGNNGRFQYQIDRVRGWTTLNNLSGTKWDLSDWTAKWLRWSWRCHYQTGGFSLEGVVYPEWGRPDFPLHIISAIDNSPPTTSFSYLSMAGGYPWYMDDIRIRPWVPCDPIGIAESNIDVGVEEIVEPTECPGGPVKPICLVHNYGSEAVSTPVYLFITDYITGERVMDDADYVDLKSGQSDFSVFSEWTPEEGKVYLLEFTTDLSGDLNAYNNAKLAKIECARAHDMAILRIVSPIAQEKPYPGDTTITPEAWFENRGLNNEKGFYLYCEVTDTLGNPAGYRDSAEVRNDIVPGDSIFKEFLGWIPPNSGWYIFRFFPFLAEDGYRKNDTMGVWIEVGPAGVKEVEHLSDFKIEVVQPNPFVGLTKIIYSLPYPVIATLSIYNASGRLVKEFLCGCKKETGIKSIIWDRTDNRGRRVSAGIYYVILKVNGKERVRKVVTIR